MFMSCTTAKNVSVPTWYLSMGTKPGKIIGYGEGNSYEEAMTKANNDLASQIEVYIKSTSESSYFSKDEYSTETFNQNTLALVDKKLIGVRKLKEELIEGMYYCALEYDARPLRQQILDLLIDANKTEINSKSLKANLPRYSFMKNNGIESNFQLENQNNIWYLLIGGEKINVNRNDFSLNFFPIINSDSIIIKKGLKNGFSVDGLSTNELKMGQFFSILYKPQLETGYLNLFYIDNDGVTINLLEDYPITESQIEFPDSTLYDGLIAEKNPMYNNSVDLILAVESPTPIGSVSLIDKVSSSNSTLNNESLLYGILLEELVGYRFSSSIVEITE